MKTPPTARLGGTTARSLADSRQLRRIDIVDISREIVELGSLVFPDPRQNPVHDPRVAVHIEDGRFFLRTTARRYDVITGDGKAIVRAFCEAFTGCSPCRSSPKRRSHATPDGHESRVDGLNILADRADVAEKFHKSRGGRSGLSILDFPHPGPENHSCIGLKPATGESGSGNEEIPCI